MFLNSSQIEQTAQDFYDDLSPVSGNLIERYNYLVRNDEASIFANIVIDQVIGRVVLGNNQEVGESVPLTPVEVVWLTAVGQDTETSQDEIEAVGKILGEIINARYIIPDKKKQYSLSA